MIEKKHFKFLTIIHFSVLLNELGNHFTMGTLYHVLYKVQSSYREAQISQTSHYLELKAVFHGFVSLQYFTLDISNPCYFKLFP